VALNGPPWIVEPPEFRPSLHGLVDVADALGLVERSAPRPVDAPPDLQESAEARDSRRWEMGWAFTPDNCIEAEAWDPACGPDGAEKSDAGENLDVVEVAPFIVETVFECNTTGFEAIDYEGRARRQLERAVSKALEAELWSGTLLSDNPTLSSFEDVGDGSGWSLAEALGLLAGAAADCGPGGAGFIHLPARAGTILTTIYTFPKVNGELYTERGDFLVIGSGYTGDGPSGAPTEGTQWVVWTPPVQVRMTEMQVLTTDLTRALKVDPDTGRRINTVQYRAEALVSAAWGCCGPFGVQANVGVAAD